MAPADRVQVKCCQFISHSSRSDITGSTQIPKPYGCKAFKAYLTLAQITSLNSV